MNPSELRSLRLIAIFFVSIAALLAAKGQWASAAADLGLLLVFSAVVVWRGRRFTNPRSEPREGEARTRRLISRTVPVLLVLFVVLVVYDILDEDWLGAGYAGVCFGVASIGMYANQRRLSEIEPREG